MTAVSSVYAQRFFNDIILISFGIYLFLATVPISPFDRDGCIFPNDTQQVSNASGVAGAWVTRTCCLAFRLGKPADSLFLFMEAIRV